MKYTNDSSMPSPYRPRTPCSRERILIVDDEQSVREVFHKAVGLCLPHCRVDLAVNGTEAVTCFRDGRHAVIVMDVRMPVMSGEEAFAAISDLSEAEHIEMPSIIFCTGFEPSHEIKNIVSANPAHCLLRKPLNPKTLLEAIRSRLKT